MILGIDFDNTIVCYDQVFHKVALEKNLIDTSIPVSKKAVRDYLRKCGREDDWTELQGYVYGARMEDAQPFPNVIISIANLVKSGVEVYIISHKTKYPYRGEKYDLHKAVRNWFAFNEFFKKTGLSEKNIFLELTLQDKIQRIKNVKCDFFIDDLPELFDEKTFPETTKKILFDPNNTHINDNVYKRVASWKNIDSLICYENDFRKKIIKIIPDSNKNISVSLIKGGGNNKVFEIKADENKYLLKSYFYHPADKRDRLNSEFSFLTFAWNNGLRNIPQPIASDAENRLGLYEFISGRRLQSTEIDDCAVQQALDFFLKINENKNTVEAQKLPIASEACFSIEEHLQCVDNRIVKLNEIKEDVAKQLVENELLPKWKKIFKRVKNQSTNFVDCNRCLSPSDFGFHNALFTDENTLKFIDFEYAGWDDPAKMICDFFCQPEIPVPMKYIDDFVNEISKNFSDDLKKHVEILFPIYQIKWCCIMLNEFLPIGDKRRRFAGKTSEQKTAQIEKVKSAIKKIY